MTPLYKATIDAEAAHITFRHPDLSAWIEMLDPVLEAAGECRIGNDSVGDITLSSTHLWIKTDYSCRGCSMTNNMKLPVHILKAADPVHAAKAYKLGNDLAIANQRVASAQRELASANARLCEVLEAMTKHQGEMNHG